MDNVTPPINTQYLIQCVIHLGELAESQRDSIVYPVLIEEALSEIELEWAILKSTVEFPR